MVNEKLPEPQVKKLKAIQRRLKRMENEFIGFGLDVVIIDGVLIAFKGDYENSHNIALSVKLKNWNNRIDH